MATKGASFQYNVLGPARVMVRVRGEEDETVGAVVYPSKSI